MHKRRLKILAVYPYLGLENIIKKVAKDFENIEIIYEFGELESGVAIAQQYVCNDIDAIISRGGTARMINDAVMIPTFDIGISTNDLIHTVVLAKNITYSKLCLVGFNEVTEEAKFLDKFFDEQFNIYETQYDTDIPSLMNDLKADGIELVIGDATAVRYAKEAGINNIMIASGEESVRSCLLHLMYFLDLQGANQDLLNIQRCVIKSLDSTFFVVENNLVLHSQVNSEYLSCISMKIMESVSINFAKKYIYNTNNTMTFEHGDSLWVLNIIKDKLLNKDLFVITWRKISKLPNNAESLLEDLLSVEYPFEVGSFDTKENLMHLAIEDSKNFAQTTSSILICGEQYTGRSQIARLIYKQSKFGNSAILGLDSKNLSLDIIDALFNTPNTKVTSWSITLVVKNFQYISKSVAQAFLQHIKKSGFCRKSRLIFIFDQVNESVNEVNLTRALLSDLGSLIISIPPLRERKGDLLFLSTVALGEFCSLYGVSCHGFTDDATRLIESYNWPGNLHELRCVIRQICASLKTDIITDLDLDYAIKKWESVHFCSSTLDMNLINGTLDEIEAKIILKVLELEKGKKTNVASRLGISRNTLWRKLKELGIE